MKNRPTIFWLATIFVLAASLAWADSGVYHQLGYQYLSPMPGAPYVTAQTRYVLVRFENITTSDVTNLTTSFITVTGANSGSHSGATHVASDGRTVIFEMSVDFSRNELVTVTLNPQLTSAAAGKLAPYAYQFMITAPMPGTVPAGASSYPVSVASGRPADAGSPPNGPGQDPGPPGGIMSAKAVIMPNGVSVPSDFPIPLITVNSNPSPGYLFLAMPGQTGLYYALLLDNNGNPVWYSRRGGWNFQVQKNGMITMSGPGGSTRGFDKNFNYVNTYYMVNGFAADPHDFRLLEDGRYLMLGNRVETVDMTRYLTNANPSAQVAEWAIQEFTAAGELISQFRGWDHYDVRDLQLDDPRAASFSFPHMNAINVDEDGHLLVSCRSLSEVTKIHRDTGDILWRLGGAHNDFTYVNDPWNGFSCQHDISVLGNNRYMVFDNGDLRNPSVSRAVEYQLNLTNRTATLTWQFRDAPDFFSDYMGNAQRLPNGNTLINWVYSKFVEVDSNGAKHFEMNLSVSQIYRVLRFPWDGAVEVPYLIVEPDPVNTTLLFNKFGDTNVAYYRIYGGPAPQPTTLLATAATTLKNLTNLQNRQHYYFRVTAVDKRGAESGYSNEEEVTVRILNPSQNMVENGDFSSGTNVWFWTLSGTASAGWRITNADSRFDITNGGTSLSSIQLRQTGIPLVQSNKYVFEFDAWSDAPRYIEAKVAQEVSPNLNYSRIGNSYVTPIRTHFRYVFTMREATDLNCRVVFGLGTSANDVWLDNVSLFNASPGDSNLDGSIDLLDLQVLTGDWLKQQNGLSTDLDGSGKVDFTDFGILGKNWSGGN